MTRKQLESLVRAHVKNFARNFENFSAEKRAKIKWVEVDFGNLTYSVSSRKKLISYILDNYGGEKSGEATDSNTDLEAEIKRYQSLEQRLNGEIIGLHAQIAQIVSHMLSAIEDLPSEKPKPPERG